MKNKKAIVLPETLKLIIAVLCIFILIYLSVSLYDIFIKKTEIQQARETLSQISAEVESLEEGGSRDFLVTSPKDWVLMTIDGKLCICPAPDLSSFVIPKRELVESDCLKKGACNDIDKNLKIFSSCRWGENLIEGVINCFKIEITNLRLNRKNNNVDIITGDLENKNTLLEILSSSVEVNGETKTLEDLTFMFIDRTVEEELFLEKAKEVLNKFCDKGYIFEVHNINTRVIGFEKNSIINLPGLTPVIGSSMEGNYEPYIELETSRNDEYYLIKYRIYKEC